MRAIRSPQSKLSNWELTSPASSYFELLPIGVRIILNVSYRRNSGIFFIVEEDNRTHLKSARQMNPFLLVDVVRIMWVKIWRSSLCACIPASNARSSTQIVSTHFKAIHYVEYISLKSSLRVMPNLDRSRVGLEHISVLSIAIPLNFVGRWSYPSEVSSNSRLR